MIRFFFDYTARDQSLLDYQGQEFRSPQGAIEFAETIAENLKHSLSGNWIGWSVEIRNAEGQKFSKIAVGMLELDAANARKSAGLMPR
jgi:hypothetical protein